MGSCSPAGGDSLPAMTGDFERGLVHRISSGRPLTFIGVDPTVASLKAVAHDDRGIRNEQLLEGLQPLLSLSAVRQRLALQDASLPLGRKARLAITAVVSDLERYGGSTALTIPQLDAVRALLYIPNDRRVRRAERSVGRLDALAAGATESARSLGQGHTKRAAVACEILREPVSQFRQVRRGGKTGLRRRTPEERLLEDFVVAVASLDAPPSSTRGHAATSRLRVPSDGADDIVGTWAGTTESMWLLKHRGSERAAVVPCFMVVDVDSGELTARWLYRYGTTTAVASSLTFSPHGRRLACLYEAEVPSADVSEQGPSHRGGCLLEIADSDAVSIRGSYWTDRSTHGVLTFTERVPGSYAESFETAVDLFA